MDHICPNCFVSWGSGAECQNCKIIIGASDNDNEPPEPFWNPECDFFPCIEDEEAAAN